MKAASTLSAPQRTTPPKVPAAVPCAAAAHSAPTRQRLLHTGLRLFAQQGYANTSTREIAEQAQVNVAAISYHFGDKAGLYRASFLEPFWAAPGAPARAGLAAAGTQGAASHAATPQTAPHADQPLGEALRALYTGFVEPLKHGDLAHQSIKLHCREMLEPTGLWAQEIDFGIAPMHRALVSVLCRHIGLRRADDDLQRLAVCIAGLGVHLHMGHDVIDALAPRLNRMPRAFDHWVERLVGYAEAMVAADVRRRAGTTASATTAATATVTTAAPARAATPAARRRAKPTGATRAATPAVSAASTAPAASPGASKKARR
jgi:TetR/AcrR family transcriptional regulator, regulator of cefoperazone and chloramphenicol sensitivity